MTISTGQSAETATVFTIWVDANANSVALDVAAPTEFTTTLSIASVRPSTRFTYPLPAGGCNESASGPDVFVVDVPAVFPPESVIIYHRNDPAVDADYVNSTLRQQGLSSLVGSIGTEFLHKQFGLAAVTSTGWTRTSSTTLVAASSMHTSLSLVALTTEFASADDWLQQLAQVPVAGVATRDAHVAWWASFWNRSYVDTSRSGNASLAQMTAMYDISRYVFAIQSRTSWPIKFNGMMFVANTPDVTLSNGGGPDYRDWGQSDWWRELSLLQLLHGGDSAPRTRTLHWLRRSVAFYHDAWLHLTNIIPRCRKLSLAIRHNACCWRH